ncbi:DUF4188 domain-containing protein [soil metagenome]
MQRQAATLPDSIEELCLIRLGIQARRLRAVPYVRRLGKAIDQSAAEAIASGAGLLHSERFLIGWNHFGVWQYWKDFEALEAWSHRPPHSDWWRGLLDRARTRGDVGVYHETYLVPRRNVESIYLDCQPVGLAAFGTLSAPVGALTAGRDRLGRRADQ